MTFSFKIKCLYLCERIIFILHKTQNLTAWQKSKQNLGILGFKLAHFKTKPTGLKLVDLVITWHQQKGLTMFPPLSTVTVEGSVIRIQISDPAPSLHLPLHVATQALKAELIFLFLNNLQLLLQKTTLPRGSLCGWVPALEMILWVTSQCELSCGV